MFNILYNGRTIYRDLSHEECSEVLEELSLKFYEDDDFDIHKLELEEV